MGQDETIEQQDVNQAYTITIERSEIPKPYLGGYQNAKTGLIYHHAFAQTDQIKREHKLKFHRDVIFFTFLFCFGLIF
jgi:hypothetical protein